MKIEELKLAIYQTQKRIEQIRDIMLSQPDSYESRTEELMEYEQRLAKLKRELVAKTPKRDSVILEHKAVSTEVTRGGGSSKRLDYKVEVIMEHIPTAIYHLFDSNESGLIYCEITVSNLSKNKSKKVKVSSYIEGYSAKAITTVTVTDSNPKAFITQLPTLFPDKIKNITELTNATLYVSVEDLETNIKEETTYTISLLARNSAITIHGRMENEETVITDLSHYLGVFVTPNQPDIMRFVREVAEQHSNKTIGGYQGKVEDVTLQVKALFNALKKLDCIYVNSVIDFNPISSFGGQRVRLPKETLKERQMNCLDGTLLYASILEAMSLNPAIVIINGHAFLAWESWIGTGEWNFLETTVTGSYDFERACQMGEETAQREYELSQKTVDDYENPEEYVEHEFQILPIDALRANGIFPME